MLRRPRVHHTENDEPVFRGDDCFALSGLVPQRLAAVMCQLGRIEWEGLVRACKASGLYAYETGSLIRSAHHEAYCREIMGTPEGDYFDRLIGRVYGE